MKGSAITLTRGYRAVGLFDVWTSQKNKAKAYATAYGLKVSLLDGEAVLKVPKELADKLLPLFGAKLTRTMSPAQLQAAKKGLDKASNRPNLPPEAPADEVLGT